MVVEYIFIPHREKYQTLGYSTSTIWQWESTHDLNPLKHQNYVSEREREREYQQYPTDPDSQSAHQPKH